MMETPPLFFGHVLPVNASLDQILHGCRALVRDNTFPTVKRWRELGKKVLGHFQVYFPEEIAHAAGMLPWKLCGARGEAGQTDEHFGSYLCAIVKRSLSIALQSGVELDMFVAPSICDTARNLVAVWARNFRYPCRTLYLPQNAASPDAAEYLSGEYAELAAALVAVTGRPLCATELSRSIGVYNRNRALLRELYSLRMREPWKLPVDESFILTAAGALLPRQEHNRLLEAVLPLLESRQVQRQEKIRVVLDGCFCEQPPLEMLEAIGRSCHVVDDDLLIGLRWIQGDIEVCGDPLVSLSRAYGNQSGCSPVQHDSRKSSSEALIPRMRFSGAQAAILAAPKMCEPGLEEQIPSSAVLDREAMPFCICEFEQTMTSFDVLELQLETFAENILFADPPCDGEAPKPS